MKIPKGSIFALSLALVVTSAALKAWGLRPAINARTRKASGQPRGSGFWSVKGTDFIDAAGNKVYFSGVIWAGFETPDACVQGLWSRSLDSHLDQMQQLGFNLIRLPFAGDTLRKGQRPMVDIYGANPDLWGLNSVQVMDKVIEGCTKRGIKVILDYHRIHLTIDNELGTWWDATTPESVWLDNWKMLATRYKGIPTIIGADLFNEIHENETFPVGAPYWSMPIADARREKYNYRSATLRAIRAIHSVEPNWIVFMEGLGRGYWWGGNVAELLKAPITEPRTKLAYSAHEYGPVVFVQNWFKHPTFPNNLIPTWHNKWGLVVSKKIGPLWVGEFGSFYPKSTAKHVDYLEKTTFETLIAYIKRLNASWTIAFWNPNSKDTGGILKEDWKTPNWRKLNAIKGIMRPGFALP